MAARRRSIANKLNSPNFRAPAARIQVVTAGIVLCGRYRQLPRANGRESGSDNVVGTVRQLFLTQEVRNLYLTRSRRARLRQALLWCLGVARASCYALDLAIYAFFPVR